MFLKLNYASTTFFLPLTYCMNKHVWWWGENVFTWSMEYTNASNAFVVKSRTSFYYVFTFCSVGNFKLAFWLVPDLDSCCSKCFSLNEIPLVVWKQTEQIGHWKFTLTVPIFCHLVEHIFHYSWWDKTMSYHLGNFCVQLQERSMTCRSDSLLLKFN